jgi:polysaccharide export outer membrane protein
MHVNWNYRMLNRRTAISLVLMSALSLGLTNCSTPAPPKLTTLAAPNPTYRIGPGDVLGVFVYGSPDLSETAVPVRPDGRFSIPLVQNILAAGKTPKQLQNEIAQRLKQYVKHPNVTVIVKSFHGALGTSVRVIGAGKPREIPYVNGMTVLDLMTEIGGVPRFGAANSAFIIRRTDGHDTKIPLALGALLNQGDLQQNVMLQPGDIVVIPRSLF